MNRQEFMARLEDLLQDISQRERVEALTYYNDYFDDAGEENEQDVINSLGSPEKVAETIKEGLGDKAPEDNGRSIVNAGDMNRSRSNDNTDWGKIILIILLCLVLSPILLPIGGVLLSIIIAIPVTFIAVIFGLGAAGIGLAIGGVASAAVGVVKLFTSAAAGVTLLGVGLLLLGIGILAVVAVVWIAAKVFPWLIRTIVDFFTNLFNRKGGYQA